ncbi:MAG: transposase family protein [Candidatus Thiodiazotropha endolucinida]|nr:transposase family protein [Candidatus Thiodiazotropha endolucinida]
MLCTPLPERPWEKLGTDIFHWKGHNYLLVIDYYSRFIEIAKLTTLTSSDVISHMKSIMSRHGICDTLVSDGAGCYTSDLFHKFTENFGINHVLSSPKYPQGNSEAERAVQTCKRLLEKADDPYIAIMEYRATPIRNGYSPSELLMGRKIKTIIPTAPGNLKPRLVNPTKIKQRENHVKSQTKLSYDTRKRARHFQPLENGDRVYVKNLQTDGSIVKSTIFPRSYIVDTPRGTVRRNRRHLVKLNKTADNENSRDSAGENNGLANSTPSKDLQQTIPEGVTVTRSGRISKPPERLQINF